MEHTESSRLTSWRRAAAAAAEKTSPTACDWDAILKTYFPKLNSVGRFGHWHDRKSSLFRGSDQSKADGEIKTVSYKWKCLSCAESCLLLHPQVLHLCCSDILQRRSVNMSVMDILTSDNLFLFSSSSIYSYMCTWARSCQLWSFGETSTAFWTLNHLFFISRVINELSCRRVVAFLSYSQVLEEHFMRFSFDSSDNFI